MSLILVLGVAGLGLYMGAVTWLVRYSPLRHYFGR